MGRFQVLAAEITSLPLVEQDEIADILDDLLHGIGPNDFKLTAQEVADLEAMVANPGPIASEEEVGRFFRRTTAAA